jgi:hypothetical protein
MKKIFNRIIRFFKREKSNVSPDQELFMKTIGAVFLHEYSKDRNLRRKIKGTSLEKRINNLIN